MNIKRSDRPDFSKRTFLQKKYIFMVKSNFLCEEKKKQLAFTDENAIFGYVHKFRGGGRQHPFNGDTPGWRTNIGC